MGLTQSLQLVAAVIASAVALHVRGIHRCLQYVGYEIFRHFNLMSVLSTDERTLIKWLQLIEAHYHPTITYHNSTHAADVLQASAFFCQQSCMLVRRALQFSLPQIRIILIILHY